MDVNSTNRTLSSGRFAAGTFTAMLALAALVGAVGAGAGMAGSKASHSGCTVQSATAQPFLPWNDSHLYFLAPGGSMESDLTAAGWTLSGGAGLVPGSEPYDVTGNPADSMSLGLPDRSSAQTPPICVTIHDPALRVFVSNAGKKNAVLFVTSHFLGSDGKWHSHNLGEVKAGPGWSLTNPIKFADSVQPGPDGTGQVAFEFTPAHGKGDWQIDDLYVDPLKSQ
jgi:hypothetical protein